MAQPFAAITPDLSPNADGILLAEYAARPSWTTPEVSIARLADAENASGDQFDADTFDFS